MCAVSQTLELDVLTLLDVACCWISSDLTTRESLFPTLLEIVADWSSLSEEQIRVHLDSQPLYAASAESLSVVLENLTQQSRLPPHYQATYEALNNKVIYAFNLYSNFKLNFHVVEFFICSPFL